MAPVYPYHSSDISSGDSAFILHLASVIVLLFNTQKNWHAGLEYVCFLV